ncbi:alpha/beta hydrolase [Neorickettsia sp. 179522]|uniref:alpha/beta hydrolase n=1 Tax=Neorickettsia sp. 179522 TaxID=1714371 RepID=UPI0007912707|nr:alpha/beta hydrolase [Neorickettsia sp. 179522]KYH12533.1 hydrolase [Neorickettsia sp. 179522]
MSTQYLSTPTGKIAYQTFAGRSEDGILFMCGRASDMTSTKSEHLRLFCKENGITFTRFDYFGHGLSDGDFQDGSISIWTQNALEVLKNVTVGKQILIGSSMSGWMMFALAKSLPERVKGLIGVAAAPDFTEDLDRQFTPETRQKLIEQGYFVFSFDTGRELLVTRAFLEDGKKNLILDKELSIFCPVILLHGLADDIVSYQQSIRLIEHLDAPYGEVRLLRGADHRMNDPVSLAVLEEAISQMRKPDSFHPQKSTISKK